VATEATADWNRGYNSKSNYDSVFLMIDPDRKHPGTEGVGCIEMGKTGE
jgi:hypothetical protein